MESGKGVGPLTLATLEEGSAPSQESPGEGQRPVLLGRRTHAVREASGRDLAETQDQSEIRARTIHRGGGGPGGLGPGMAARVACVPTACSQGFLRRPDHGYAQVLAPSGPAPTAPRCLGEQRGALPGPSAGLRLGHPSARALDCFLPSAGGLHTRPNTEPCRGVGVGPPTSPCPWWGQRGKGSGEATATASCPSFPAGASDARKPRALAGRRAFLRKAPPAAAASVRPCPTGRSPQSGTRGFPAGAVNPAPPSPSWAGFYEKWLHSGPVASRDPGSVAQPGKCPLPTAPPPNAVVDSAPSE